MTRPSLNSPGPSSCIDQIYLAKERKVSVSSRTVAVSALRFFYAVTLKQVLQPRCSCRGRRDVSEWLEGGQGFVSPLPFSQIVR